MRVSQFGYVININSFNSSIVFNDSIVLNGTFDYGSLWFNSMERGQYGDSISRDSNIDSIISNNRKKSSQFGYVQSSNFSNLTLISYNIDAYNNTFDNVFLDSYNSTIHHNLIYSRMTRMFYSDFAKNYVKYNFQWHNEYQHSLLKENVFEKSHTKIWWSEAKSNVYLKAYVDYYLSSVNSDTAYDSIVRLGNTTLFNSSFIDSSFTEGWSKVHGIRHIRGSIGLQFSELRESTISDSIIATYESELSNNLIINTLICNRNSTF